MTHKLSSAKNCTISPKLIKIAMEGGKDKIDATPLLHTGSRVIGFWQLDQYFFEPFVSWNEEAHRRKYLVTNLSRYIRELRKFGIPLKIWLDGSFTTSKIEPDDIDLVVWANEGDLVGLQPNQQSLFERLTIDRETIRAQFDLDVFLCLEGNQQEIAYWTDLYSKGHSGQNKGFFKIELSHV